jgi:molybdopterin/thiamine biosynthesis adenylyltransferase/ubiquitin-protein ligase
LIWYITDPDRLAAERQALQALENEVSWLTISAVRLAANFQVCVDFEIAANGRTYAAVLQYPQTFPFTAPSITPQTPERWSSHQYGTDELCLERGPDNWTQETTGAEMVRSAERLLSGEAVEAGDTPVGVPSRHSTTLGQDFRTKQWRAFLTESFLAQSHTLAIDACIPAQFRMMSNGETHVVFPTSIALPDAGEWINPDFPTLLLKSGSVLDGFIFTLPPDLSLPKLLSSTALLEALAENGLGFPSDWDTQAFAIIALRLGDMYRAFIQHTDNGLYELAVLTEVSEQRLGVSHLALKGKTVGLIGCGSAGSKVATTLARSGVERFVLVDDDLLLPGNLVRNDLDWSAVGEHKVDGLARRISFIAPASEVRVRRHRLGGQEANGSVDWLLTQLESCDLIIDATADPRVFNLVSGLVHAAEKPMVWLEIFVGGIGGLIARSRPGLDPSPQDVRSKIETWCLDNGIAAPRPANDYGAETQGSPLIADDADVSIIAAHASRFCLDILIGRNPSSYLYSAYLIGLTEAWAFTQPFCTIPLDMGPGMAKPVREPPAAAAIIAVVELIKSKS